MKFIKHCRLGRKSVSKTHPDQNQFKDVALLLQYKMGEIDNKKTVAVICMIFEILLDINVELVTWQTNSVNYSALLTRTILLVLQFITLYFISTTTNSYFKIDSNK